MTTARVLPPVVDAFLAAQDARDGARALACFTADAVVVDDGTTYTGSDAIKGWVHGWQTQASLQNRTLDVPEVSGDRCTVLRRVTGDFPGGVVDLRFQFVVRDGAVSALTINP